MPRERSKSTLPVLFSIIVIDVIGFGIIIPVLPFYADEFGASGFVLGMLFTSHAAMQALFAPLWGRLADRIGRRPVMLCTIAGTSGALLFLGLADTLAQLFVARILSGIFAANISVATAYIADVTDDDERTRWMGMVGACFGVGFIVGPAVGGPLALFGYGVPMLVAAGLAAVNFVYAIFVLKEPEKHHATAHDGAGKIGVLAAPNIRNLCITYFLFTFAVTQLETVFAYFMMSRFDYGVLGVTGILIAMAFVMVGIQGGGMRSLVARHGEGTLLVVGLALMALSFAVVPWAPVVGLLMVPLIGSAIGRAISQPSMMGLASFQASASNRGAVMGTFQSSASMARVLGPLAAGALYDQSDAAPFLLASALLFVALASTVALSAGSRLRVEAS
jgi:DHA1 family tetracycline resistance protein-like MFS transporter